MVKKKPISKKTKKVDRPDQFGSYAECIKWQKRSVYLIVRRREEETKDGKKWKWITLGTGFVGAPNRLLTCSHVLNDPLKKNDELLHRNGDAYFLIRHDDEGNVHWYTCSPELNKELFIFPETDLGIIYLSDDFYGKDGKTFINKKDYLPINKEFFPIGTEVGILGYPMVTLQFENDNPNKPKLGNILLRTDTGVINTRYKRNDGTQYYEFTINFNPGNSGGPIFNVKSGRIISIVHGFNSTVIDVKESDFPDGFKPKKYSEPVFIKTVNTSYSVGIAITSSLDHLKRHKVL